MQVGLRDTSKGQWEKGAFSILRHKGMGKRVADQTTSAEASRKELAGTADGRPEPGCLWAGREAELSTSCLFC